MMSISYLKKEKKKKHRTVLEIDGSSSVQFDFWFNKIPESCCMVFPQIFGAEFPKY